MDSIHHLVQLEKDATYKNHEDTIQIKWDTNNVYQRLMSDLESENCPIFNFVDGPPFVSSDSLHPGHALVSYVKSCILNYMIMHGYMPANKLGYDTHGLPIEQVANKILGLNTKKEIEQFGIGNYNQTCKDFINKFSNAWQPTFKKVGRWADFENTYKTMDWKFMESTWWVFSELYKKNLVYQGCRVMPYSPACAASLSNFEAGQCYEDIETRTAYVFFPLIEQTNTLETGFVAWTTTPWTLVSNIALCLNPNATYIKVSDGKRNYIVASGCENNLGIKIISVEFVGTGKDLCGVKYIPIFDFLLDIYSEHKTVVDDYVTVPKEGEQTIGTGIVHIAPSFGEDDHRICIEQQIVTHEQIMNLCQVDDDGCYTDKIILCKGLLVTSPETDKTIIIDLKQRNRLIKTQMYKHSYPHCWRTSTPLIYRVIPSVFVKVTAIKDKLIEANKQINWSPSHIGSGRFHQWLQGTKDWNVSRGRFFGTPIPLWVSDDGEEIVCIESIQQLKDLTGITDEITDLHREFIDKIKIPSKMGKGMLNRIPDVFDCWFESGAVPFGQYHYPFENSHLDLQADFIAEGIDQTRGWFYTLNVLFVALFNKPAFKNVICTGLICAEDGKKMSKRLGNFSHPLEIINEYGSDVVRLYMLGSPAVKADVLRLSNSDIEKMKQRIIPYINAVKFMIEHIIDHTEKKNTFDLEAYKNATNVMDIWIMSKTGSLLQTIEKHMSLYQIDPAVNHLIDFVEDLTNWYVKFNRDRLKGHNGTEERTMSLSVLNFVITKYCLISAPFMPFLSEMIYSHIGLLQHKMEYTIFKNKYPNNTEFTVDQNVERRMARLQQVVRMVRFLRGKEKQFSSVKVPLSKVIVKHSSEEFIDDINIVSELLQDEVNCLSFETQVCNNISYVLVPNQKNMGKKFRTESKKIQDQLQHISQDQMADFYKSKSMKITITNVDYELDHNDITVQFAPNEITDNNIKSCTEEETIVAIDTTYNNNIMNLHLVRLFITNVQNLRKRTNLHPWNSIIVYFTNPPGTTLFTDSKEFIEDRLKCKIDDLKNRINNNEPDYTSAQLSLNDEININVIIVRMD